ncbi:hypothetical protein [Paenibacillus piri]|uniref:Uncharacterized protein n=1 Tax=Paenibacillus piri TaxID=2547395 RepID=A0A4V2ZTR0_9BACL|nr:hypothetical protein [Paenibacillus piri]TDF98124.1 hypothetical protein E1757_11510 [Paenibacillus piri]
MDADLQKKLRIQTGQRLLLLNAPEGYLSRFTPLPDGVQLDERPVYDGDEAVQPYDLAQLFVRSVAELAETAPVACKRSRRMRCSGFVIRRKARRSRPI